MVGVLIAGPFFPNAVTASSGFATLVEGTAALLVMTPMMLSLHGEQLRRDAEWVAYQNRDLDKWATEVVNEEPKLDVLQLQKALDLREMEIECETLDQRVWDVVDEDLTQPELDALQRAVNQRASREMDGW